MRSNAEVARRIRRIKMSFASAVLLPVLLLGSTPRIAAGQEVRVIAQEAAVRLDPSPNSVVIMNVTVGTMLEFVQQSGAWFIVNLPNEPGYPRRIGYISASDAELFGVLPPKTDSTPPAREDPEPLQRVAPPAQGLGMPLEWQERYDRAVSRRSGGKRKLWMGVGGIVASWAVLQFVYTVPVVTDFSDLSAWTAAVNNRETALRVTQAVWVGGAGLSVWGLIEWLGAKGDISDLEIERRRSRAATLAIPLGSPQASGDTHVHLVLEIGPRTVAGLRWSW